MFTVTAASGTLSHANETVPFPCAVALICASPYAKNDAGAGAITILFDAVTPDTDFVQVLFDQSDVAMVTETASDAFAFPPSSVSTSLPPDVGISDALSSTSPFPSA